MNALLRLTLVFAVGSTLLASRAPADERKYTLKDLQALDQSKSWQELLLHLQDLPPGERTADWNRVVKDACTQSEQIDSDSAQYCLEPLNAVLAAEPQNKDFAWSAGKWARQNLAPWTATPFFAAVLTSPGDARCQDADVTQAIVSGLDQSAQDHKTVVAASQKLAFTICWPEPKLALINALDSGAGADLKTNSCPSLKQKNALSNLQSKLCAAK